MTEGKPKKKQIDVDDFMRLPVIFYNSIGVRPFEIVGKSGNWIHWYFGISVINMSIVLTMQIIFVVTSFRDNGDILLTCNIMAFIACVTVGVLKIIAIQMESREMTNLVGQFKSFSPLPSEWQEPYLRRCKTVTLGFGGLFSIMLFIHSISPFVQYAFQSWWLHLPNVARTLPFVSMAPWEWRKSWRYYPTYLLQMIAGYTAVCGHIAADLTIFSMTMLVTMHFDKLTESLRNFDIRNNRISNGAEEDLKELRLTNVVNKVFGIPLLLNFVSSSVLVCLVGFQLTLGISIDYFFKQLVIIVAPLLEVYLLCHFSQMLITAVC
ncbi:odorant receptor 67a-like [Drosophila eugracilis]|uniref:odorant receptor 67a-like n=1 Tax=Drosophila eugracilis TaxID=29029 RepID=UPI001BDB2339|nr:odorant receptor 67a-like [Drosophila eugracilis]